MDDLIEELTRDLRPIRRRQVWIEAAGLALLLAIEVALWAPNGGMRYDLLHAAGTAPSFWWKTIGAATLLVLAGGAALASLDPARPPRRVIEGFLAGLTIFVVTGAGLAGGQVTHMADHINPRLGVNCLSEMLMLATPPLIGLGLLMRRGAPTEPEATALTCGLAAAGGGILIFVLTCPSDDPMFIAFWYPIAAVISGLAGRLILPWIARW
jgi:hypothetical protein